MTGLILIQHKMVDGWHVFITDDFPGFYVASIDKEKAIKDIVPSLNKLIELDLGIDMCITEQQILII